MFSRFLGNQHVVDALRRMLAEQRLPQTLLFAGPAGVGKATLARLLAAALSCAREGPDPCGECSHCRRILQTDLALPEFRKLVAERASLPAEKRRDNPLVVSVHPEFLCFPPDGPLAQVSIEQVRRLREYARLGPSESRRRIFLVDHADRMDLPAANSLLKTLEEPPPYLTVILTAENSYDLLPTIRSRCVPFFFAPLRPQEMTKFLANKPDARRLSAWAQGSPGRALALDVAAYESRRAAMLALLRAGAGSAGFGDLLRHTEALARDRSEKLELLLEMLYGLLHDLLRLQTGDHGLPIINEDLRQELAALGARVDFAWLDHARAALDELDDLTRRNIQKQIALEALAVKLRAHSPAYPGRG